MMNINVDPIGGRQLPRDWQAQAANNRISFDAQLREKLENQWRKPLTSIGNSSMQAARLGRKDSRLDALRLVVDDDEQEIWNAPGVRVIRRKNSGQ